MKIVSLCTENSCCPVVKITDTQVEIGEAENTCVLTKAEWELLKEKIQKKRALNYINLDFPYQKRGSDRVPMVK